MSSSAMIRCSLSIFIRSMDCLPTQRNTHTNTGSSSRTSLSVYVWMRTLRFRQSTRTEWLKRKLPNNESCISSDWCGKCLESAWWLPIRIFQRSQRLFILIPSFAFSSLTLLLHCAILYCTALKTCFGKIDTQERTQVPPLYSRSAFVRCSRCAHSPVTRYVCSLRAELTLKMIQPEQQRCSVQCERWKKEPFRVAVIAFCAQIIHTFQKCHFANGLLFISHRMHYR